MDYNLLFAIVLTVKGNWAAGFWQSNFKFNIQIQMLNNKLNAIGVLKFFVLFFCKGAI